MLAYFGFNHFRLAGKVEQVPAQVTVTELCAGGVDNAHVTISDFYPTPDYVAEENKTGQMKTVWQPVVCGDDYMNDNYSNVQLVLKTTSCRSQGELVRLLEQHTVTGVVVNEIEGLDSETKKLLRESYPNMDTDNVLIVDADRALPSKSAGLGMMVGGVGLTGAGVGGFALKKKRA